MIGADIIPEPRSLASVSLLGAAARRPDAGVGYLAAAVIFRASSEEDRPSVASNESQRSNF
jgi:hypothetical protein